MPKRPDLGGKHRYGYVLLTIMATFIVLASGVDGPWVRVLAALLEATTLILVFYTAGVHPEYRRFVVGVVVGAALLLLLSLLGGEDFTKGFAALLAALFALAAISGIVRGVGLQPEINIGSVAGALAIYLMLGFFFADVYAAVGAIGSEPFFAAGQSDTTSHFFYFSYATQTTVGYGDFTAASDFGRTLAVIQALIGQIYLVAVVGLVVANIGRKREPGDARRKLTG